MYLQAGCQTAKFTLSIPSWLKGKSHELQSVLCSFTLFLRVEFSLAVLCLGVRLASVRPPTRAKEEKRGMWCRDNASLLVPLSLSWTWPRQAEPLCGNPVALHGHHKSQNPSIHSQRLYFPVFHPMVQLPIP